MTAALMTAALMLEPKAGMKAQPSVALACDDNTMLGALAEEVRAEGWGWVAIQRGDLGLDCKRYGKERKTEREPTREEVGMLAALEARRKELIAAHDANEEAGDPYSEADGAEEQRLSSALDEIEDRIEAAHIALEEWTPEQVAHLGAVLCINAAGEVVVHRGLFRRADRPPVRGTVCPRQRPAFSQDLMRDLSAHRTATIQAALMQNTHVALATLVHRMAETLFARYGRGNDVVRVRVRETGDDALSSNATSYEDSPAGWLLGGAHREWVDRLPGSSAGMFRWLLAQDQETLLSLLAYCTARSIHAVSGSERSHDQSDAIAEALGLDMADWWMPNAANYLAHVTRSQAVEAVREATGLDCTGIVIGMTRAEATQYCASKLEGTRWLPEPLRPLTKSPGMHEDEERAA